MSVFPVSARALVALGAGLLSYGVAHAADAQPVAPRRAASRWARVTLAGEWAHLGAGPVSRPDHPLTAARSLTATASYALTDRSAAWPLHLDLGWVRGVRSPSTSQGVTAGVSLPLVVEHSAQRLHLTPGVAVAAGWSESQSAIVPLYDWRGLPNTGYAGQTGTQTYAAVQRSRMTGVGVHVGGDLALGRGVALTGSVRQWHFAGAAAAPNRQMTLAGVGVAVRPWAIVGGGRR